METFKKFYQKDYQVISNSKTQIQSTFGTTNVNTSALVG